MVRAGVPRHRQNQDTGCEPDESTQPRPARAGLVGCRRMSPGSWLKVLGRVPNRHDRVYRADRAGSGSLLVGDPARRWIDSELTAAHSAVLRAMPSTVCGPVHERARRSAKTTRQPRSAAWMRRGRSATCSKKSGRGAADADRSNSQCAHHLAALFQRRVGGQLGPVRQRHRPTLPPAAGRAGLGRARARVRPSCGVGSYSRRTAHRAFFGGAQGTGKSCGGPSP